jgi:hypothetical protein
MWTFSRNRAGRSKRLPVLGGLAVLTGAAVFLGENADFPFRLKEPYPFGNAFGDDVKPPFGKVRVCTQDLSDEIR